MKTIAIILAAVALAVPVCAHAQNVGHSQKAAVAAQGSVTPPDGQDPDPYIVHG